MYVALLLLLFTVSGAASAARSGAASVTFQADALHDGFVANSALKLPLKQKWSVNTGGTLTYPVVADGLVISTSGTTLFALRESDGKQVWSVQAASGEGNWVGVAYDSGRIFAQAEYAFNYQPSLFAFKAKTGAPLWSQSLEGQYAFSSPPVAANGFVYTGGAGTGGTVYAFDEKSGKPEWTAEVENGDNSSPVVDKTALYVSYACPQTYDFNPATGSQTWYYSGPCEGGGGSTGVLNNGLLFVEDSDVYQGQDGLILNAASGAVAGSFNSPFPPAFGDGSEYLVESGQSGEELVALDPSTQSTIWTAPLSGGASFLVPPFVVNSVVYEESSTGSLIAYAASSGSVLATYTLATGSNGLPLGIGAGPKILVVPSQSGTIYGFSTK